MLITNLVLQLFIRLLHIPITQLTSEGCQGLVITGEWVAQHNCDSLSLARINFVFLH